ncbi:MAG: adenosylcobinamide-GDP ribazoletransferase [Nitrososphaeria archaeon]|nr:adenosylcobinamide-GDP ribazoletransferase [Nitrosopumilaceae archaeon]NIP10455.1 adenosylcobinamide-GDP ribazoletransferase [Nitrosopumilaceae archaeon]NIP90837.1 adenosylcobinamide-GDP ribazoletransferase [Nitrososphaeria archaeon]NIS95098.1 adenosylcobinamide-GDP ribazoletransferase [Nitrosopumilaceae archaeon]
MLKEIGSIFSFLTIIPTSSAKLEIVAKYMYLFPIVGIAIGLLVGSIGFGLSFFLDPLIVSLLVVASLALITGIHHTDGLADFADGLMAKGSKEKKLGAMKDLATGSAGIVAIVLYLVGLIVTISLASGYQLFLAILLSEIVAKFSMVLMASIGNSASVGSNSPFVELMKNRKKLLVTVAITLIPLVILGGTTGLILFAVGTTLTIFLVGISTRSFGGITGDVLGSTNELSRLACLLVFVSI